MSSNLHGITKGGGLCDTVMERTDGDVTVPISMFFQIVSKAVTFGAKPFIGKKPIHFHTLYIDCQYTLQALRFRCDVCCLAHGNHAMDMHAPGTAYIVE